MAKTSGPPVTGSASRKALMRPWQQREQPLAGEDSQEPDQKGYIAVAFLGVFFLVMKIIMLVKGGL